MTDNFPKMSMIEGLGRTQKMSWLSKLLGQRGNGSKSKVNRTRSSKYHDKAAARRMSAHNKVSKANSAKASEKTNPFRAVVIHSMENCCEAAERNVGQKFLAAHAPQLPLGTCDKPQQCHCRYKYLNDRRQETRRDEDHGLPRQPYHGDNRRYRRNRRKTRAQRQIA